MNFWQIIDIASFSSIPPFIHRTNGKNSLSFFIFNQDEQQGDGDLWKRTQPRRTIADK